MKRFFAKASRPFALPTNANEQPDPPGHTNTNTNAPTSTIGHTTPTLQPKYILPPMPHPCPHDHLAILATENGLLIRPYFSDPEGGTRPHSYIRIAWGKTIALEEVDTPGDEHEWEDAVIVYGIVGVLELYSCPYVFVITSRSELGSVLDNSRQVYGVKGVIAIPLTEERARSAIRALSSRNAALSRPSIIPQSSTVDSINLDPAPSASSSSLPPRVQFLPDPQIKIVTPTHTEFGEDDIVRPPSPSSTSSTPSSEHSTTPPIFKALASRMSFWTRLSKREGTNAEEESIPLQSPQTPTQEQEALDKIIQGSNDRPVEVIDTIVASTAPPPATQEERRSELEDKVVRECIREFTKGGMYFSYTFDLTRSIQHKREQIAKSQKQNELLAGLGALASPEKSSYSTPNMTEARISALAEPHPALPLWRRVDKQFWWNEWMSKHFVDAGLHPYVLPIMQGYFQVANFALPVEPEETECNADYIIISRRSRDRAGLRYQRRGIDEDARVANFVETETIMKVKRDGMENIFSYVQIRGSIPVFWTQTGYGLKPPPVLASDRTHEQHFDALRRHFRRTIPIYGPHTIINLAEQQGKEAAITKAYRDYMQELESKDARYYEYDFHTETKGMKYENISKLILAMERVFEAQGFFWISDDTVLSQQKGVFRVNCIDCLDRTNVVQSAFARHVMNNQLGALALINPSSTKRPEIENVFNDVWANNGDAISRAYAGTSALKGDFTRTGKRDLNGLLNDGVNSLARMYTSTFSDWFCQAVLDFMLGNRTVSVFSEFLHRLQSSDPRDLIRLSKIRAEAIATAVSRVLPEGERLLSGWTLFAPEELNTKSGLKFEEKVLLLSAQALYIVSYDYTLEKVKLYTRVPLGDITCISKGAYILSPLEEASRDPEQNAGFVVMWVNSRQESRVSSYSVRNSFGSTPSEPPSPTTAISRRPTRPESDSIISRKSITNTSNPTTTTTNTPTLTPLSRILGNKPLTNAGSGEQNFAAFKVLPVDPARVRRISSSASNSYSADSEEVSGASSCREVVDRIVDSMYTACKDIGGADGNFVVDEDVVSLAEAQRTTTMYAKMEYGVKRLLWLGG